MLPVLFGESTLAHYLLSLTLSFSALPFLSSLQGDIRGVVATFPPYLAAFLLAKSVGTKLGSTTWAFMVRFTRYFTWCSAFSSLFRFFCWNATTDTQKDPTYAFVISVLRHSEPAVYGSMLRVLHVFFIEHPMEHLALAMLARSCSALNTTTWGGGAAGMSWVVFTFTMSLYHVLSKYMGWTRAALIRAGNKSTVHQIRKVWDSLGPFLIYLSIAMAFLRGILTAFLEIRESNT